MHRDAFSVRRALVVSLLLLPLAVVPSGAQTKNLVTNGSFDTSLAGWTVISNPIISNTWKPADATGGPGSGTARVVLATGHEDGAVALRQCVTVNGAARYAVSLRTRTAAPRASQSVVSYSPFGGTQCDGAFLPGGQIALYGGSTRNWETQHFTLTPPPGTQSYQLDLDIQGGPGSSANTVDFDDVFLGPVPEPPFACVDGPISLCLDDEPGDKRFAVQARFRVSGPLGDDAAAVNLGSLGVHRGGLFWFFAADNPELLVKVLNGCGLNHRNWIFAAAGTNVGVELFVIDTRNGAVSWIHNPVGRVFPTVQDTGALGCTP